MPVEKRDDHLITRFDRDTCIHWFKCFKTKDLRDIRFLAQDVLGLQDMIKKDQNPNYDYNEGVGKDSCIIITDIGPQSIDEHFDKIKKALDCFVKFHGDNTIIAIQLSPSESILESSELEYREIECVDALEDLCPKYQISNHQEVLDSSTGEILKQYKTEEGLKVLLDFKTFNNGFNQKLVSISYLMEKTFNPSISADIDKKIWDDEMNRLCKFYEKLGFISIQEYCQFEYAAGYVYGNTIGKALAEKAKKVNECF